MLDDSGQSTSKTGSHRKHEMTEIILQMKQQDKNLQDQTNEEEIDNLSEKVFRVIIVKMIQNIRNKMEA